MKQAQPRGLNRTRVQQLLAKAAPESSIGDRIEIVSRQFLGSPYRTNPLIGSPDEAEVFTAALDGFDCVTYMETAIALARASTVDGFISWLRRIRYADGRIEWKRRNHY